MSGFVTVPVYFIPFPYPHTHFLKKKKHLNIVVLFFFYAIWYGSKMDFEQLFLISVKNIDLRTGLTILNSLSNEFSIQNILIKKISGGCLEREFPFY